jgi:hypothetical protein
MRKSSLLKVHDLNSCFLLKVFHRRKIQSMGLEIGNYQMRIPHKTELHQDLCMFFLCVLI